jgi:threonylcarbamoyladenosine tRNA methylthiotransferase MtaB
MKRYRTITLGCKVNQCESAAIGYQLERAGCRKVRGHEAPDVVVINTCTVTGKAAMQSRQAVRKAVRACPGARIVVTGCHAQVAPEQIRSIEGVHLVVGHHAKMGIAARLCPAARDIPKPIAAEPLVDTGCTFASLPPVARGERTRAFLKIQDGCNTRCTYCIVPHARGRSRSMPLADVLAHMRQVRAGGFREVVLTGIHLGVYGADLSPPTDLTGLLQQLTQAPMVERIRLSSIEPTEINERLVDLFGDGREGCLCRHFHIPLQSGDDAVLRRMGRPYTGEQFARVINRIHRRIPLAAIGVDVMAGFPGETDEAFDHTRQLIERLPIAYLHVFPFSPRKGTPAAEFKNNVPEIITRVRCRQLRQLGEEKRKAFLHSMVGQCLTVLVQTSGATPRGLSDNYLPVVIEGAKCAENTLARVRIERVSREGLLAGAPI